MNRRNRQHDSTMDSSSYIAVQVPDVIYLFLKIIFVIFENCSDVMFKINFSMIIILNIG